VQKDWQAALLPLQMLIRIEAIRYCARPLRFFWFSFADAWILIILVEWMCLAAIARAFKVSYVEYMTKTNV
jgi:hypothetical protein